MNHLLSAEVATPEGATDPELMSFADGLLGDVVALQQQVAQLRADLACRVRMDQASGILMQRNALDAASAYQTLHRWSRATDLDVEDVALAVVVLTVDDANLPPVSEEVARTVLELLRRQGACESSGRRRLSPTLF